MTMSRFVNQTPMHVESKLVGAIIVQQYGKYLPNRANMRPLFHYLPVVLTYLGYLSTSAVLHIKVPIGIMYKKERRPFYENSKKLQLHHRCWECVRLCCHDIGST